MNIIREQIVLAIPRLLSLLDRNRASPTFGCFDRDYWNYKMPKDFPASTYQYACLALAILYSRDFEGNVFYRAAEIRDYSLAACHFWTTLQHQDGSFDEWFINEHSYVATAFGAYAVSETMLALCEQGVENKEHSKIIGSLIKAGKWLAANHDHFSANHSAGAVCALYNIFLLTKNDFFKNASSRTLQNVIKMQDTEGWFNEYGGADIGYQSVSLDFLAKYYIKTKNLDLNRVFEKGLNFLKNFLHTDGTVGGEYGSRNTMYLFPHGLTILSQEYKLAGSILAFYFSSITKNKAILPSGVDDRYFLFFFLTNYLQAMNDCPGLGPKDYGTAEFFNPGSNKFDNAGLICKNTPLYQFLINYKKNGVLKIFSSEGEPIFSDSGYFGKSISGKVVSSHFLDISKNLNSFTEDRKQLALEISGSFAYLKNIQLRGLSFIFFRLFVLTVGWNGLLMNLFNRFIKSRFLISYRTAPLKLNRKVILKEDEIIIEDVILANPGFKLAQLFLQQNGTTKFVSTSNYAVFERLPEKKAAQKKELAETLNQKGSVELSYHFKFPLRKVDVT